MKINNIIKILISFGCMYLMLSFSACNTTSGGVNIGWGGKPEKKDHKVYKKHKKGGPPPHAPAHGHRAKHVYRYYPASHVYYDVHRGVYFYLSGENWRMSVSLPQYLRVQLNDHVSIEMESDKPYTKFSEHKRKYPPGQMKKKKKEKWAKKK